MRPAPLKKWEEVVRRRSAAGTPALRSLSGRSAITSSEHLSRFSRFESVCTALADVV